MSMPLFPVIALAVDLGSYQLDCQHSVSQVFSKGPRKNSSHFSLRRTGFLQKEMRKAAQSQLAKLDWPGFQIHHFLKNAGLEDIQAVAAGPKSSQTTVYFGTTSPFDPARAGTLDEFTNPKVALEVFAKSFGKSDGYVNILENIPRKALQGRMSEPDTMPFEQAVMLIPGKVSHHIRDLVTYSVPSKEFERILNACCSKYILNVQDPNASGIDVFYINPAFEEKVNKLILDTVRSNEKYRILSKKRFR